MIKINLLTSYRESGAAAGSGISFSTGSLDDEKKQLLIDVAKRLVVIVLGPIGLHIYETQNIPTLNARLNEANIKLADLTQFNESKKALNDEIQRYENEQARFNAQMDFINKISADKVNEYKLFSHLKESTPEGVWIRTLELDALNKILITAESTSNGDIEKFITRLSNADFIKDLIPIKQTNIANYKGTGISTTEFELTAILSSTAAAATTAGGTQ